MSWLLGRGFFSHALCIMAFWQSLRSLHLNKIGQNLLGINQFLSIKYVCVRIKRTLSGHLPQQNRISHEKWQIYLWQPKYLWGYYGQYKPRRLFSGAQKKHQLLKWLVYMGNLFVLNRTLPHIFGIALSNQSWEYAEKCHRKSLVTFNLRIVRK